MDTDIDDLDDLFNALENGGLNRERIILQLRFRLFDAYELGWYEATNGKWGLSLENPWDEFRS